MESPQPPVVRTFGADTIGSVQSLLGTIVIAVFVITFVVQAFQIPSQSMENTLLVGDYLLVDKLCYGGRGLGDHLLPYRKISRGDIIVFHYPVHVLGIALIVSAIILFLKPKDYDAHDVEVSGLYWHFVDLVWMFIFPLVYLMSTKVV